MSMFMINVIVHVLENIPLKADNHVYALHFFTGSKLQLVSHSNETGTSHLECGVVIHNQPKPSGSAKYFNQPVKACISMQYLMLFHSRAALLIFIMQYHKTSDSPFTSSLCLSVVQTMAGRCL